MNRVLTLLVAVFCSALAVAPAQSQLNYPNRPVRLIVTFPPGGSSDVMARIISPARSAMPIAPTWSTRHPAGLPPGMVACVSCVD